MYKWRRRRDSNPRNPFEVRFFSKEVLSATQSRLQKQSDKNTPTSKINRIFRFLSIVSFLFSLQIQRASVRQGVIRLRVWLIGELRIRWDRIQNR